MSASLFNLDGQYAPQKGGAYPMRLEFLDAAGAAANLAGTLELRVLGRDQLALLTKAFAVADNVAQLTLTEGELAALPTDMLGYDVRNLISTVPYLVIGGGFNLLSAGSGRRHGLTQLRLTYGSVNMQLVVTGVPGLSGAVGPQGPGSIIVTLRESGSIPVPPLAVSYKCEIFGQGAAGGSGRKGAPGTVRCGGGAAGVGMYAMLTGSASELNGSVACVVAPVPAGGAAVTDDDTDGKAGQFPSDTSAMLGEILLKVPGANPGNGGNSFIGTGGSRLNRPTAQQIEPAVIAVAVTNGCSSSSGSGGSSGPNPTNYLAGYSGAGGGITAVNTPSSGGNGGYTYLFGNTLFARGLGGAAGGASGAQSTPAAGFTGSPGCGGGGSSVTGNGGDGANGVGFGGGGGGGGAATNDVGNSGKGGDGTAGAVRMTFYF